MDFVDQEALLLKALQLPEVMNDLKQRIDLLMVDEFQDTSPLQLALFLKLSTCAQQSIWVGDVKQAIYGFRGTDPQLMQKVIAKLQEQGNVSYLNQSWRSQPDLVELSNEVFTQAFAGDLTEEQVVLSVPEERNQVREYPGVMRWTLEGKNAGLRTSALVAALQELQQRDYAMPSKDGKSSSAMQWGDMAILCKSNNDIATVASALSEAGIPAKFPAPGLLQTPEAVLLQACLSFLIDEKDILARTEVHSLTEAPDPEQWLKSRLDYRQHQSAIPPEEKQTDLWLLEGAEKNQYLCKLQGLRTNLKYLSPVEVVQTIYRAIGIQSCVLAWKADDATVERRLANLNALLERAERYQEQCETTAHAATVSGFLLWLSAASGGVEDAQAIAAGGNAVTVRTHHGAKGLEWKVVVLMGMDKELKSTLWGARAYSESEFDLQNPLANRSLHYWPNPFGNASKGIQIIDKINESDLAKGFEEQMRAEQLRLLYVSFTRAREMLILPKEGKPKDNAWRSVLEADWLMDDELILPSGQKIRSESKECTADDFDVPGSNSSERRWYQPGEVANYPRAYISPSSADPVDCEVGNPIQYGERLTLPVNADMQQVGDALHQIIAVDFVNREQGTLASLLTERGRIEIIKRILKGADLGGLMSAEAIASNLDKWADYLRTNYKVIKHQVELPVHYLNADNQQTQGWIDMLLETEQGYLLIDHKSSPRPMSEWRAVVESYSGQLECYQAVLGYECQKMTHFFVGGGACMLINVAT